MKVLISDNISNVCKEILTAAKIKVDVRTGMKPAELKKCIGEYHGMIIRSATKVTADILDAAKNLKVIARAGAGLDNVDRVAATKKGVVVMNTPGGNTMTTAEHTIALLISLARLIPQATISMKAGKWEKKKFMGVELYNKTLGIIGIGNIGGQVAKRMQAFSMEQSPLLIAKCSFTLPTWNSLIPSGRQGCNSAIPKSQTRAKKFPSWKDLT